MMTRAESYWLNASAGYQMDELLWSLRQESRSLQELRRNGQGVWDDSAARELAGRYLDPHETESQQLNDALALQAASLDQAAYRLQVANALALEANNLSTQVVDQIKVTEQELSSAYSCCDQHMQYLSESCSKLPRIQVLVQQANNTCK
jgi:hypothetical protein